MYACERSRQSALRWHAATGDTHPQSSLLPGARSYFQVHPRVVPAGDNCFKGLFNPFCFSSRNFFILGDFAAEVPSQNPRATFRANRPMGPV